MAVCRRRWEVDAVIDHGTVGIDRAITVTIQHKLAVDDLDCFVTLLRARNYELSDPLDVNNGVSISLVAARSSQNAWTSLVAR